MEPIRLRPPAGSRTEGDLLRDLVLFALPLLALFVVLELVVDDRPLYERSEPFRKVTDFIENAPAVDVVVFGSSHADNAISEEFFPSVANLANQGQDLRHDEFLYDLVRGRMDSVDVVVLTLSFFSFRYDENKVWPYRTRDYDDAFTAVPRGAGETLRGWVMDRSDLINYNLPLYGILGHYVEGWRSDSAEGSGEFAGTRTVTAPDESTLRQDAVGRAVRVHRTFFNTPESVNLAVLNRLIRDNQKAGRLVVAMVPPFHRSYLEAMDPARIDSFYVSLRAVQKQYGLPVLDYAGDRRFAGRPELFANSDHLNSAGARVFTPTLLEDLVAMVEERCGTHEGACPEGWRVRVRGWHPSEQDEDGAGVEERTSW